MIFGGVDMTIPPPSALSNYFDDDTDYIQDPDKFRDVLPQPFRLLNKIVEFTFDIAWEQIEKREAKRIADSLRIRPLKFECQIESKVEGSRAITSSSDGEYVFIGTDSGVAVVRSLNGEVIDQYNENDMMIATISSSILDEGFYILSTVDVLGTARLFLFNGTSVMLVKVLNEMDSAKANLVEVSEATDFIAVSLVNQNSGEAWVDFHKVPKDLWLKEANSTRDKTTQHQKNEDIVSTEPSGSRNPTPEVSLQETTDTIPQDGNASINDIKSQSSFRFSNTSVILKVKAPVPLKASSAATTFSAFKVIDTNSDLVATGVNHILSSVHLEGREKVFKFNHRDLTQYDIRDKAQPIHFVPCIHFITATRYSPQGYDSGKPVGAVIRWSNRNQLLIYSLVKQAKDVCYRPEQVWPMPHLITASAVSPCTQLLAIGFTNGSVVIWDLYTSLQRRIHSVTPGHAIRQIDFMNPSICQQDQPFQAHLPYQIQTSSYVLVLSENGQLSYCDTTMGIELTKPKKVLYDELDSRLVKFAILPGMPFMILATFSDNNIYIVHALNGNFVCQVVVPPSHVMDENCFGTVAAKGQVVFCKGLEPRLDASKEPQESIEYNVDLTEECEPQKSTLFVLQCLKFKVLETSWSKKLSETGFVLHTTVDKRLEALMQQRFSQQPIRQTRIQASWQSMGSTLELILKAKQEESRPGSVGSRYAASTVVSSNNIPDTPPSRL